MNQGVQSRVFIKKVTLVVGIACVFAVLMFPLHYIINVWTMDLERIINGIYPLPVESLAVFKACFEEKHYLKGALLYKQNTRATAIYFVKEGLVRAFARRGKKQITFWIGFDGELAFPIQSVFSGAEEYAGIELLEDSTIYEISLARLQELYMTDIHIANWGRKYAEYACIVAEKLFISRQFRTSLERYNDLLEQCPEIVRRVPLGIIASYLGITQVNLSRIRALVR